MVKNDVYHTQIQNEAHLRELIVASCRIVTPQMLATVRRNFVRRVALRQETTMVDTSSNSCNVYYFNKIHMYYEISIISLTF
jgi:hypothetical protein